MLRYWTAGESHGKGLIAFVDGFPSGVKIDEEKINHELGRRQGGYGRGDRQTIETDFVDIMSGMWRSHSTGAPIALWTPNRDYKIEKMEDIDRPRPGHGDLSGGLKYLAPVRHILERASARETAARVSAGALVKILLAEFGIRVIGYVASIGPLSVGKIPENLSFEERMQRREASELYTLDPDRDPKFKKLIDKCKDDGDTYGGVIEVRVEGVPFGLGTHTQWDKKLDGRLAQAVMAVQAMKGVEIGLGFEAARRPGSEVHDAINFDPSQVDGPTLGYTRPTNRAGGIEAGMTNSQPIVVRAAMKPISTLKKSLESVSFETKEAETAAYERSDVCAISAASVVIEQVVAFEIGRALVDKFGGDSLQEMKARRELFEQLARER
jgi:chorismate synthase